MQCRIETEPITADFYLFLYFFWLIQQMYVKSFCKHNTVLNTRSAEDAEAVKTESLPRGRASVSACGTR